MPEQLITTPGAGTWTVPDRVTEVLVALVGGGGGGGGGGGSGDGTNGRPGAGGVGGGGNGGTSVANQNTGPSIPWAGGGGGGATTVGTLIAGGGGGGGAGGSPPARPYPPSASGGIGGVRVLLPGQSFQTSIGGRGGLSELAGSFGRYITGGSGGRALVSGALGGTNGGNGLWTRTTAAPRGGESGAASVMSLAWFGNGGSGSRGGLFRSTSRTLRAAGSGGGGGGYIAPQRLSVTPGQVLSYTVGGGGGGGGSTFGTSGETGASGAVLFEWTVTNVSPSVLIGTPPQVVREREEVELVTTAADADGTITSYAWTATSGTFDDPTAANPTWTAPLQTAINQAATLAVTVTDNNGATASASVGFVVQRWDRAFANGKQAQAFYLNSKRVVKFYFNGRPFGGTS